MNTNIEFAEASAYLFEFGRYIGMTMDDIAKTNRGLLWLDWLRSALETKPQQTQLDRITLKHLRVYLDDPTIEKDLRELVRSKEERK
jgi:hypothetical protein